jgi:hypothetical protein
MAQTIARVSGSTTLSSGPARPEANSDVAENIPHVAQNGNECASKGARPVRTTKGYPTPPLLNL